MNLKGSQTEKNLLAVFAGESQARNRYTFFARDSGRVLVEMKEVQGKSAFDCNIKLCKSQCCRNCPVLTENEVAELIKEVRRVYALELDPKKYFRKAVGERGLYFAIKMIKGQCIFLNKDKRCRIYKCRPKLCELYPVINVDAVDVHCPNVSKGEFPGELLATLKKRYANEIDEKIKCEQTFRFI